MFLHALFGIKAMQRCALAITGSLFVGHWHGRLEVINDFHAKFPCEAAPLVEKNYLPGFPTIMLVELAELSHSGATQVNGCSNRVHYYNVGITTMMHLPAHGRVGSCLHLSQTALPSPLSSRSHLRCATSSTFSLAPILPGRKSSNLATNSSKRMPVTPPDWCDPQTTLPISSSVGKANLDGAGRSPRGEDSGISNSGVDAR